MEKVEILGATLLAPPAVVDVQRRGVGGLAS